MRTYQVVIAIDVDAETPETAARDAWTLLTSPDALLPICEVREHNTQTTTCIDLAKEEEGNE
jgi:hypothetical protein